MKFKVGDRVKYTLRSALWMESDDDPVKLGATGTVVSVDDASYIEANVEIVLDDPSLGAEGEGAGYCFSEGELELLDRTEDFD